MVVLLVVFWGGRTVVEAKKQNKLRGRLWMLNRDNVNSQEALGNELGVYCCWKFAANKTW